MSCTREEINMKAVVAILLLAICTNPVAAECTITDFYHDYTVTPADPVVGETVTVTVSGFFGDSCGYIASSDCGELVDQELGITVGYGHTGGICDFLPEPFELSCAYTFDEPGSYLIRIQETASNGFYCTDIELPLEVAGSVAVEVRSWSTVKAKYR
jgi:hypothetical protein